MPLDPCHIAPRRDADLILVGGGLANGMIAWRLKQLRPSVRVLVLEAGDALGGNHTWSFHGTDLEPAQLDWVKPLVVHQWTGHEVVFPTLRRRLAGSYASVTSARFNAVLSLALGDRVSCRTAVAEVTPTTVRLQDGTMMHARAVIDGRGETRSHHLALCHQKFFGQEVRLAAPHGLTMPVLMDADVDQAARGGSSDGYRFVYVLPLSADTLLIEDTVYSDSSMLDDDSFRQRIADYARAKGWQIAQVLREERGVLPLVLSGSIEAFWDETGGVPRSGLAAGLFHPTTGYSLAEAVSLAELVASQDDLSAPSLHAAIRRHATARWRHAGFYRLLNRMLFRSAEPGVRWKVLQRFYGLPEPLIARFYGSRLRLLDKLRIVTGKPPVPIVPAMRAALDRPHLARAETR